jgi:hypothetical protein
MVDRRCLLRNAPVKHMRCADGSGRVLVPTWIVIYALTCSLTQSCFSVDEELHSDAAIPSGIIRNAREQLAPK